MGYMLCTAIMWTRSMTNFQLGEKTKVVIEQPLIADLITNTLLNQKDWTSVIQMRSVFRIDVHDKLEICKKINETNKKTYDQYFFDHKIAHFVARIQSRTTFMQRIYIHNDMFQYIINNTSLFERSMFNNYVHRVLMYYIENEPYYERHAIVYMRRLFPDTYYSETFQETYDDHESHLFDMDYD
jgi:hypothetical protein